MRLALVTATVLTVALWLPAAGAAEDLTIYSSLPLVGDARPQSEDIVRAEQLALEQSGNRAGPFSVRFVSLNDAPAPQRARGRRCGRSGTPAAPREDPTTIAYLGEFNSGASRDLDPGPQ